MTDYIVNVNSNLNNYQVIINPISGTTPSRINEDVFSLNASQTVFTLDYPPLSNILTSFYINGIRQESTAFTIASNVVTVTGFTPTNGDTVVFSYFY